MVSREHAFEIQNRISALANTRLFTLMENYFEQSMPPDQVVQYDTISLDLGEVDIANLEDEIEERFMKALEKNIPPPGAFLKAAGDSVIKNDGVDTIAESDEKLLEYFLYYGTVPWWASAYPALNLTDVFDRIIHSDSAAAKKFFQRVVKEVNVIKRITFLFPEEKVQSLIALMEPAEASYMLGYYRQVITIQLEIQLVKAELTEFKRSVLLFILNYLLIEKESEFSKKMFLKSNLQQMAMYYGVSYTDLLQIFYTSLHIIQPALPLAHFRSFIGELYVDENPADKSNLFPADAQKHLTEEPDSLLKKIEIIDYYLVNGSLPFPYLQLTKMELSSLLLFLAKDYPSLVKKLFLPAITSTGYHNRLFELAAATDLRNFLQLIFPESETRFNEMALVFGYLQKIQPFVKIGEERFNEIFWRNIFNAFISAPSVPVDEGLVIAHILKGLQKEFAFEPPALHYALDIAMQRAPSAFPLHNSIIHLLKRIAEEAAISFDVNEADNEVGVNKLSIDKGEERFTTVALKDILRFVLQYGSMPWWGKGYYKHSVDGMLEELFIADRQAFIGLLMESGLSLSMKERLRFNFPPGILPEVLAGLPYGVFAVDSIMGFTHLLNASQLIRYYDSGFIEKELFTIAWEVLMLSNYTAFSEIAFYLAAISRLSKITHSHPDEVAKLLYNSVLSFDETTVDGKTKLLIRSINEYFKGTGETTAYMGEREMAGELPDAFVPGQSTLNQTGFILKQYFGDEALRDEELVLQIGDALRYFLLWNRLPDQFNGLAPEERQQLLWHLLLFSFENNQDALQNLLAAETSAFVSVLGLPDSIPDSSAGIERELTLFMQEQRIKKINRYLKQQDETGMARGSGKNNSSGYLEIQLPANQIDGVTNPGLYTKQRSIELIEYFILYNRLPDGIGSYNAGETMRLLKSLMLYLYSRHMEAFKAIFKKGGNVTASKLQLYDLFVVGHDIQTANLVKLLDESRQYNLIQFLTLQDNEYRFAGKENLDKLLGYILQDQVDHEKTAKIKWLFSSASFARIILEKYDFRQFLQLAVYKLKLAHFNIDPIDRLPGFLERALQNDRDKESALHLLRLFNIDFVLGHLMVKDEVEYMRAFFQYVADHSHEAHQRIYIPLFEFSERMQSDSNTESVSLVKLILSELPAAFRLQKEKKIISRLVPKTGESALVKLIKEELNLWSNENRKEPGEEPAKTKQSNENEMAPEKDKEEKDDTALYIGNAGLVLFHPFFTTYFERVGLLENNEFKSVAARHRAVLLLQYFAEGLTLYNEFDLVLNKILCDVPLAEAIPTEFIPTAIEINTTEELFEVFINRWPKMKNTSVEGIRSSFIMRNGLLKKNETEWVLRVEQRGYDILLQTLPWAFGFIKTPIMNKPIMVEWI